MTTETSTNTMLSETAALSGTDSFPSMDPRLQRLVARRRRGTLEMTTASTGQDEVAVIAKVKDVKAWEGLSEVRVGGTIGKTDANGTTLVTARIPVSRIEYLRQLAFVKSLKVAQLLQPTLDKTIEETGARVDLLPAGQLTNGGEGVVVGIIDYGCDFMHQNFRDAGGGTRLLSLWHQAGQSHPGSPFGYGREFLPHDINAALQQANPYQALGYGPAPDNPFQQGTHGTHVMDIAAGNGRGSNVSGVAPQADLIFVDVSHSDLPSSGPGVVGKSFGDSTRLLEALRYIFDRAGDRPCVINISLGTNGGPHDGSTLVEEGIDRLIRDTPNRAIVLAAANAFADGIHAAGQVPEGGHVDLVWQVASGDMSHNELELWYAAADRFAVEIIAPGGVSLGKVDPGQNGSLTNNNQIVIFAANRLGDPNNGDNMIGIFLEEGLPGGQWTIRIHGVSVQDGNFHAWIERDNFNPSRFAPPHNNSHTIGSISCGRESIAVGSYDAHKTNLPLSFFSSAGPTRDGRPKPEISAPGHAVFAAHSRTGTGVVRKSGTSMAAPAVTGIIALVLAEAQARGVSLTNTQIRDILQQTVRRVPPAGTQWHPQYGDGRISAKDAVAKVQTLAGAPPSPSTSRKSRKKRSPRKK